MQYRFHDIHAEDVEFFEPAVQPPSSTAEDIREYIQALREPDRTICSAVVLQGNPVSHVAAGMHLSHARVTKILRSSLRPLAEDMGFSHF